MWLESLKESDPVLKNEAIVIGAHYDHIGLGGLGSLARDADSKFTTAQTTMLLARPG